jgi:hypothetical protein
MAMSSMSAVLLVVTVVVFDGNIGCGRDVRFTLWITCTVNSVATIEVTGDGPAILLQGGFCPNKICKNLRCRNKNIE